MSFCIIELQTARDGTTAIPPLKTAADKLHALETFLATASAASVSSVPVHTVVVLDESGEYLRKPEVFVHDNVEEV